MIEQALGREHVARVDRQEIDENGEYDLEGLFIRLNYAIQQIGAKRVMLDTVESLFSGLSNQAILRAELRRLFYWLKSQGMSTVITGERGEGNLTRQGLEEYVSDCVILLDHRILNRMSTRRLRVVKYRGSTHGTNEYPFLIDEDGISVMPITALRLQHQVSRARVSSGVPALDQMLGGGGYYRGTSVLVSGTADTGKTSLASHFAAAACGRGERCQTREHANAAGSISARVVGRCERNREGDEHRGELGIDRIDPAIFSIRVDAGAGHASRPRGEDGGTDRARDVALERERLEDESSGVELEPKRERDGTSDAR